MDSRAVPDTSAAAREALVFIRLSLAAAVLTIALKTGAWWVSGSVGLLSDAMESFVNLAGAGFALLMLKVAAEPPDSDHPWGHNKAEYFSSGFEGGLILLAGLGILWEALPRLVSPQPVDAPGLGLLLSAASTGVNLATSLVLARAGRRLRSVVLEADAAHLMTDVWTSLGVMLGLVAVIFTGWHWLDALVAVAVALHIFREGWRLMGGAIDGLMDKALPPEDVAQMQAVLARYADQGVSYQNLRTRRSGTRRFAHVDILVPGDWSVAHAHALLDEIEARMAREVDGTLTTTHLEPARPAHAPAPPAADGVSP
ncbi:MAG: cation diffusion facilitator family transporter [Candidatus Dactylopiibacterium sp.]|nr:cation diffusion facilitator family transporter [Candidatus Dactylopiibacterium sp.]